MKIFPSSSIKKLDAYTIEHEPIASIDLMERAAQALTKAITNRWNPETPVTIFAGPGNNGGDALAIARMMAEKGYKIEVYLFNTKGELSPDCQTNKELVEMMEGDNGIGVSVVMDYRKGYPQPKAVPGFDWKLHDRREKILDNKKARCKAVEDWIRSIEDGQARYVFRMFYIEGMTWDRIAAKIGYSNSPDYPRLMIRDKYLKEHNIV